MSGLDRSSSTARLNRAEAAVNARTPLLAIKAGANGQICYQVSMHEPSLRTSRKVIAGGVGAAIALAGTGFFLCRMTVSDAEPSSVAQPAPVARPSPPTIEAPRLASRAELLALRRHTAGAQASWLG